MGILQDKIQHIVVLMLENRSFDSMLGALCPQSDAFDGLSGDEFNFFTPQGGKTVKIKVWNEKDPGHGSFPGAMNLPNPDPGELFLDINQQIFETSNPSQKDRATMGGFSQNYSKFCQPNFPDAVMHYYISEQVPILSKLAKDYAVCDQWFASAPCQTWPNRFFLHTGTAGGFENNEPVHFPYLMPTIFTRFNKLGRKNGWKIYYHDMPQSSVLSDLWLHGDQFHFYDSFKKDAANGSLPSYSFIEPRYFSDLGYPNDQHPPHDVSHGEALIADVFNALQASPAWQNTLLVITYDEHGGCFDHRVPPEATPPEAPRPGQAFAFDRYGVRVPAVIVSPYVKSGTILRAPAGSRPFDHTSIIATIRRCFDLGEPLTDRDRDAPDLSIALTLPDGQLNLGVPLVPPSTLVPDKNLQAVPMSDLQKSLYAAAAHLPDLSALSPFQKVEKIQQAVRKLEELGRIIPPALTSIEKALPYVRDKLRSFFS